MHTPPFEDGSPIYWEWFHCYVSLPEGTLLGVWLWTPLHWHFGCCPASSFRRMSAIGVGTTSSSFVEGLHEPMCCFLQPLLCADMMMSMWTLDNMSCIHLRSLAIGRGHPTASPRIICLVWTNIYKNKNLCTSQEPTNMCFSYVKLMIYFIAMRMVGRTRIIGTFCAGTDCPRSTRKDELGWDVSQLWYLETHHS